MIGALFSCFVFYSAPIEIEIAKDRTIINKGALLPVGIYRGEYYTVDSKMQYIPLEITNKMYGDYEVCKIKEK